MKQQNQTGMAGCMTGLLVAGGIWFLAGVSAQAGDWKGDLQAGTGYWAGDATYSIGGETWSPEGGTEQLPDKISELKFPLDVVYGSIGGRLQWKDRIELRGTAMANLTDPSTKMEDSDWGVFPESDEDTLDIFSESDAELTAVAADVGARYWFGKTASTNRHPWSLGVGPGVLYQHLEWTVSNLDQWYPSRPEMGHDYVSGTVGSYECEIVMPYVDVSAMIKMKRATGRLEIGIGPAFVQDEDDHKLREILAKTDMTGFGVKGLAELRYDFTDHLFALARVTVLSIEASGTEENYVYGGEDAGATWEIDHDFSLTSITGGFAVGLAL